MSNLLLSWLNDEIGLSEPIHGFGMFRDGYLLGEILHRYNQIMTFHQFIPAGTPQNTLDNFALLQPIMSKIGLHFTSKVAAEVMKGNETVTKSLLYEMKIRLEAISRNCQQTLVQNLRGTKHDRVLHVIPKSRGAYDQTVAKTFKSSIRGALENTNAAMMSAVMKKYEDRTVDYFRTISMGESLDQETIHLQRQRAKDIYKSRREHDGEFDEAWEALNVEKWKQNQRTARARKDLTLRITAKLQLEKTDRQTKAKTQTRNEAYASMTAFDDKLEKLILPDDAGKDLKFVQTFAAGSR